jgi:hypothetical protein
VDVDASSGDCFDSSIEWEHEILDCGKHHLRMTEVQVVITLGARCSMETMLLLQQLLGLLSRSRRARIALLSDKNQNFDVEVNIGVYRVYGQKAVDYVANYVQTTQLEDLSRVRAPPPPIQFYAGPPVEPGLKVIYPPYSGASRRSPAIGPGAYYEEHRYLPQEGSGLYSKDINAYRFIPPRDSKTRIGTVWR